MAGLIAALVLRTARRSRRQTIYFPGISIAGIAKSIVQAILPTLPKLDFSRHHAIASPKVW